MKSKKVYGLLGVAALAVVVGTFAYYNSTDTFVNQFDTTNHGTSATEQFDPSKGHDWVPGAEVDKSVYATNTGDGDVWVRIKFNEKWSNLTSDVTEKELKSSDWNEFQPDEGATAGDHQRGEKGKTDGLVKDDGSVVYKILVNNVATPISGPNWYFVDGYFYYCKPLTAGETTVDLLQKVKLCGDTDMGEMTESPGYFTIANKELTGQNSPKPQLNPDGTLKNTETGWYPLAPDGSVPTKKVTNDQDKSYYYIPVDISNLQAGQSYDSAPAVGNRTAALSDTETVYTYKAKVLNEDHQGYANANYNLDITVEFVQADEESAKAFPTDANKGVTAWVWNPETLKSIGPATASNATE